MGKIRGLLTKNTPSQAKLILIHNQKNESIKHSSILPLNRDELHTKSACMLKKFCIEIIRHTAPSQDLLACAETDDYTLNPIE